MRVMQCLRASWYTHGVPQDAPSSPSYLFPQRPPPCFCKITRDPRWRCPNFARFGHHHLGSHDITKSHPAEPGRREGHRDQGMFRNHYLVGRLLMLHAMPRKSSQKPHSAALRGKHRSQRPNIREHDPIPPGENVNTTVLWVCPVLTPFKSAVESECRHTLKWKLAMPSYAIKEKLKRAS